MLLERTAEPDAPEAEEEERLVAEFRDVVLPVLRRVSWSAEAAEREVLPVLRLVVAELLPEERLVVLLPELREVVLPVLRRVSWSTLPALRVVVEPVLRLVVAEEVLPEERLVLLPVLREVLLPVLRRVS